MDYFPYGQTEIEHLSKHDGKLAAAIKRHGIIKRPVTLDPFVGLIQAMISQQISTQAARTVRERLRALLGEINPIAITTTSQEAIQRCGMTMRKAGNIKAAAEMAHSGAVAFADLNLLSDNEVVKALSAIPGVGTWTAEMLLIFTFLRSDVVSWGDLGIRKGMAALYGYSEVTKEYFDKHRRRYAPFGSVASLYLWAVAADKGKT